MRTQRSLVGWLHQETQETILFPTAVIRMTGVQAVAAQEFVR